MKRDMDEPAGGANAAPRGGVRLIGMDAQVNAARRPVTAYQRVVQRVVSEPGLATLSSLSVEIDPTYEQVMFHHVDVRRGPITTTRLAQDAIRVAQRERGLERDMVDGLQTVTLFIEDLRVGDELDYAYSVRGDDPTMGGYFASSYRVASYAPAGSIGLRLLTASGRPLQIQPSSPDGRLGSLEPTLDERDGVSVRSWLFRDVPAYQPETDAPPATLVFPLVFASEFPSWQKVAELASRHHRLPARSPGVEAWVKETRARTDGDDAFMLAATRFVQDEIRYVGLELGMGRRVPTAPDTVLRRRYGDCKDKAGLLIAILRAAELDAQPALVSSTAGETLSARPPSLGSFDHVIVRTQSRAGKTLWIDATDTLVGGDIRRFETEIFRQALVLEAGTDALTAVAPPTVDEPSVESITHMNIPAADSQDDVVIDVERTYRGRAAENLRRVLRATASDGSSGNIDEWKHELPGAKTTGPRQVHDDRDANVLVTKTFLRAPGFWRQESGDAGRSGPVNAHDLVPFFEAPPAESEGEPRRAPYFLGWPDRRVVKTIVHLPFLIAKPSAAQMVRSAETTLELTSKLEGKTLTYVYDGRILRDRVPAADGERLRKDVAAASELLFRSLTWKPPAPPALPPAFGVAAMVAAALLGLALGIALMVLTLVHDPATQRYVPAARFERLGGWLWLWAVPVMIGPFFKGYEAFTNLRALARHGVWAVAFTYSPGRIALLSILNAAVITWAVALPLQALAVARLYLTRRATLPNMLSLHVALLLCLVVLDDFAARAWPDEKTNAHGAGFGQAMFLLGWLFYMHHADRSLGTFVRRRSGEIIGERPGAAG